MHISASQPWPSNANAHTLHLANRRQDEALMVDRPQFAADPTLPQASNVEAAATPIQADHAGSVSSKLGSEAPTLKPHSAGSANRDIDKMSGDNSASLSAEPSAHQHPIGAQQRSDGTAGFGGKSVPIQEEAKVDAPIRASASPSPGPESVASERSVAMEIDAKPDAGRHDVLTATDHSTEPKPSMSIGGCFMV